MTEDNMIFWGGVWLAVAGVGLLIFIVLSAKAKRAEKERQARWKARVEKMYRDDIPEPVPTWSGDVVHYPTAVKKTTAPAFNGSAYPAPIKRNKAGSPMASRSDDDLLHPLNPLNPISPVYYPQDSSSSYSSSSDCGSSSSSSSYDSGSSSSSDSGSSSCGGGGGD